MDTKFAAYNNHLYGLEKYWEIDNHLRMLQEQVFIYQNPLIQELPKKIPGIYTIGGGRQIGKTTLLKQWIVELLKAQIPPENIVFYTGELIDDHHALVALLQDFVSQRKQNQFLYIIIDEITYIKDWDKGIKFAADAGYFHNCVVVLTGSDLNLMQAARMTFPGRRGKADNVDYHIYPLSFKENLQLKNSVPNLKNLLEDNAEINYEEMTLLYDEFATYLKHGGYLTAINDIARDNAISIATLKVYSDWIRGDMLKRGKQEPYLKEILLAIIQRYNKQISWHNLADAMSIDSHHTVSDYCMLLASMDALFIQAALLEDKLVAAPKKPRKLSFTDPFIYHAIKYWLIPENNPYQRICDDVNHPNISADIVEALVSNQFRRFYPTYYIKAEGEIDLAYVDNNKFWPIEVKWRNQLRPLDLKQISKYKQGRVFSKTYQANTVNGLSIEPLPLALLRSFQP